MHLNYYIFYYCLPFCCFFVKSLQTKEIRNIRGNSSAASDDLDSVIMKKKKFKKVTNEREYKSDMFMLNEDTSLQKLRKLFPISI